MLSTSIEEARRQSEICNACRYCEGYCSVFPAIHAQRAFSDGDITQFANLCHNCRGCYYACQYTAPHEFDLNLPQALGNVRQQSWQAFAYPKVLANLFHRHAAATVLIFVVSIIAVFGLAQLLRPQGGAGFYAFISHGVMVSVFAPAFVLPLFAVALAVRAQWADAGRTPLRLKDLIAAGRLAASMKNLSGGHGDGCNYEDGDRFSQARRIAHQLTLWGFLLCFASTSAGTIMHYGFALEAPYSFFSAPKLLGVPGGIMLCAGTLWLTILKTKSDPSLGEQGVRGPQFAFLWLLFAVSATGLALYAATGTAYVEPLLTVHLASVLTLFLLLPYTKMAHGFHRFTALTIEAARQRLSAAG